jgi:hypothetical protein
MKLFALTPLLLSTHTFAAYAQNTTTLNTTMLVVVAILGVVAYLQKTH